MGRKLVQLQGGRRGVGLGGRCQSVVEVVELGPDPLDVLGYLVLPEGPAAAAEAGDEADRQGDCKTEAQD